MSTTSITPENVFQFNQESSASKFMAALEAIQSLGTGVLDSIETANSTTLVQFDIRLQATNARRVRAWRVLAPQQAAKVVVSDFSDIDQVNTVATVRADSASVSLKERAAPAEAAIRSTTFTVPTGNVQALNNAQSIVRVTTSDGSTPTGQFNIELVAALSISQLTIDIVASPGTPTVTVATSSDGVTYTQANNVAVNGYQITVFLPSIEVKFIQMQVTPSHPDNLNGSSFTFGITDISAAATTYQLRSDFLTKTQQFNPKSEFVVLNAPADPNILYYLSIWPEGSPQAPFVELNPGDTVQIGTGFSTIVTTSIGNPNVLASAPATLYPSTVSITETTTGFTGITRIAQGLSPTDPNILSLQDEYVVIVPLSTSYNIQLLNAEQQYNPPRTFEVSYVYGPSLVNFQLKVRLTTSDDATTPLFTGASLDEM
jgi:hypothetical protein